MHYCVILNIFSLLAASSGCKPIQMFLVPVKTCSGSSTQGDKMFFYFLYAVIIFWSCFFFGKMSLSVSVGSPRAWGRLTANQTATTGRRSGNSWASCCCGALWTKNRSGKWSSKDIKGGGSTLLTNTLFLMLRRNKTKPSGAGFTEASHPCVTYYRCIIKI